MRALVATFALGLAACSHAGSTAECKPGATGATEPAPVACVVGAPVARANAASASDPSLEARAAGAPVVQAEPDPTDERDTTRPATKLIVEALKAGESGQFELCIAKDREALALVESSRTLLHLASCEQRNGKLIESLKDSERALQGGIRDRDAPVMKIARSRVKDTLERIPHVTFVDEPTAKGKRVLFDGRDVPADTHAKKFSIDPGPHVVEVTTYPPTGAPQISRCEVTVAERTFTPITIR